MIRTLIVLTLLLQLSACGDEPVAVVPTVAEQTAISASGELESKTSSLIAPPSVGHMWQYQIKTMVPENTKVKVGQVVVTFDDKQISDRLIDEQGKLQRAKKELENKEHKEQAKEQELILALAETQMEYDKSKRRIEIVDNSKSENDRRKAQIDFTIAKADLAMAKKRLAYHRENSQMNLKRIKGKVDRLTSRVNAFLSDKEKLKVKAPIDGMVIYRANWEGERPAVGESVQFGQPVIEIAVVEQMQVLAQVAEPDSGKLQVGQKVKVFLDTANEIAYSGRIAQMGRVFRDKSYQDRTRVIDATISLDNIDLKVMRPGMSARVEIDITTDELREGA